MANTTSTKRNIGNYVGAQVVQAVKTGPDKVFGKREDREKMNDEQAKEHFRKVWNKTIKPVLEKADVISNAVAISMVSIIGAADRVKQTCVMDRVEGVICIAHVLSDGNVDELWFPPSSKVTPKGVWVEFKSMEEKKTMERLAGKKKLAEYILAGLRKKVEDEQKKKNKKTP